MTICFLQSEGSKTIRENQNGNKRESKSSVQSLSHVQLFETPRTTAGQASLSITKLMELAQTLVHWVGEQGIERKTDVSLFAT